jgi:hypothetical protein
MVSTFDKFINSDPEQKELFDREYNAFLLEEWAKAPEIQSLVGALKPAGLPSDITISDIRKERLAEKYKI